MVVVAGAKTHACIAFCTASSYTRSESDPSSSNDSPTHLPTQRACGDVIAMPTEPAM